MEELLTRSESMSREYCCSIVRIGDIIPVEGSDFLGKTIVDGFQIVVRKDQVTKGDLMFYASNETELNEEFLYVNNQFEDYERNINYKEVKKYLDLRAQLVDQGSADTNSDSSLNASVQSKIDAIDNQLKQMRGFFNKYGRVKMITLRKCPSFGYLFGIDAMEKYCPKIRDIDLAAIADDPDADKDFDTVDGKLFIKAYMPRVSAPTPKKSKEKVRQDKLKRFDRLVQNQFVFHYDTQQLNKNINRFHPDDLVYISVKLHGTSFICGNLKVRNPKVYKGFLGAFRTFINKKLIPNRFKQYEEAYDDIYSSRTVIKNQYINENAGPGFYKTDIWGIYQQYLKGHIPEGMTIYGEIVGYLGQESMIQKNYDYGCNPGDSKLMIYRITTDENGEKREWEMDEVIEFSHKLMEIPILADHIIIIPLLYKGTLRNLYPELPVDDNWANSVLEQLKQESRFGMEKNESLCTKHKVPREGVVFRIANDPIKEAFKLKCSKFLEMEGKLMDAGEADIESTLKY